MQLYYAETGLGACIRVANDEDEAYEKLLKEVGTANGIQELREATDRDIAHVKAMGGRVPKI